MLEYWSQVYEFGRVYQPKTLPVADVLPYETSRQYPSKDLFPAPNIML